MRLLDLHVGRPVHRGALSIFPVWNGNAVADTGYDLHSPQVRVEERAGAPVVSELVATNRGLRPALVLSGELLTGGRQHRVATRSTLVPVGESVVLDVRCVEEGRWSGGERHHRGRRAPASLRGLGHQGDVWRSVRRQEQRHGSSATHSVVDAMDAVRDQAARLVAGLQPLAFQSGVLIGIAGAPMLLEAFDSPEVLASVWQELLAAAAFDAVGAVPRPTDGWRAREFLQSATSVPMQRQAGDLGVNLHGTSNLGPVELLVWRHRAVHFVAANARHELVEI